MYLTSKRYVDEKIDLVLLLTDTHTHTHTRNRGTETAGPNFVNDTVLQ